jgi:DNA topoisomerase-1
VNGVKEKVSNFVPEPAGLFLGRGKNKVRGRVKRDINPNEVTINIGKDVKEPKPPRGKWKKVVHDTKAEWISKWTDPLNGKPKYIRLSDEGQFKSDSDAGKFENARKLNAFLDDVRREYKKNLNSSDKQERQLATVISLVDQYGIRMGGEKGELEAKTYGASTLLFGHIKFTKPNKIHLHFLGKDSILYDKTLIIVDPKVFKNLKEFVKGKSKNTALFDLVSACDINNYLKKFDKGLSGKVFRTRLGSTLMYNALVKIKLKKKATISEKKKAFIDANIIVAKALNHKKTVAKGSATALEKLKTELIDLEKELKIKKKGNRSTTTLEKRVQSKKDAIDAKNKLKAIATSTSLTNYIDPRLVTAWCKANKVPVEKIYTKTLYNKFKWAIDNTEPNWDYVNTDLLNGFEQLQPQSGSETCEKPSRKQTPELDSSSDEYSDSSSDDDDDAQLIPPKRNTALISKYHQLLKKYGYVLVKLENERLAVQRVKPSMLIMQIGSTYKNIYEISKKLLDEGLGTLGMLLIGQVCFDATNNSKIKKTLVKSGYINKMKTIVRQSFSS